MTIETKYTISQIVYCLHQSEIRRGKITNILVSVEIDIEGVHVGDPNYYLQGFDFECGTYKKETELRVDKDSLKRELFGEGEG